MCIVLTVLYAGFAALTFAFSRTVLTEMAADYSEHDGLIMMTPEQSAFAVSRSKGVASHFVGGAGYDGYIGERFDIRPTSGVNGGGGFVAPTQISDGTLT